MKFIGLKPMCRYLLVFVAAILLPLRAAAFDHSHQIFSALLQDVVVINGHQSRVRYDEVIQQRATLEAYLQQISAVTPTEFDGFSDDEQLAFLINTYNGYQLKQVIDHYPLESIKDVGSFFSSPWSKQFFRLFGEPASLDHVEHGLIRTLFTEPRIHFAVNCASISCPPLMNEAFVASNLNAQLEAATFNFLSDTAANRLEGDTLYLSKIFDWYEEDFENVVTFVGRYQPAWLEAGESSLNYTAYDWNLNEAK